MGKHHIGAASAHIIINIFKVPLFGWHNEYLLQGYTVEYFQVRDVAPNDEFNAWRKAVSH